MVDLPPYNDQRSGQWYSRVGTVVDGPMPADLVFQLSDTTMDNRTRYVCKAGFEQWYPLKDMRRALADSVPANSVRRVQPVRDNPPPDAASNRPANDVNAFLANFRAKDRGAPPKAKQPEPKPRQPVEKKYSKPIKLVRTRLSKQAEPQPQTVASPWQEKPTSANKAPTHNPFYDRPQKQPPEVRKIRAPAPSPQPRQPRQSAPRQQAESISRESDLDRESVDFIRELIQNTPYKPTLGEILTAPVRNLFADLAVRRAFLAFVVCAIAIGTYWGTQPKTSLSERISQPRSEATLFQKIGNLAELLNLRSAVKTDAKKKVRDTKSKSQKSRSRRQVAASGRSQRLPKSLTQFWEVTPHRDGRGFAVKLAADLFVAETARPNATLRDELRALLAALKDNVGKHEIYVSGEVDASDPKISPDRREFSVARKRAVFVTKQLKMIHPKPHKIHLGGAIKERKSGRSSVTLTLREKRLVVAKKKGRSDKNRRSRSNGAAKKTL